MCATRRVKPDYKDDLPMQSLVHIAHGVLKMEFCNSWQDREMRTGDKKKKKKRRSQGNVDSQAQSNNLFNLPASCRVLQAHQNMFQYW